MTIDGVTVHAPGDMPQEEAQVYVLEEIALWKKNNPKKILGSIHLVVAEDGFIEIKAVERSPIKRVRRITGYLSTEDRFNPSKQAELSDRKPHI